MKKFAMNVTHCAALVRLLMASCAALSLSAAARAADAPPSPEELLKIEKQIIESRKAIQTAHVVVEVYSTISKHPQFVGQREEYTFWLQKDKNRVDLRFKMPDSSDWGTFQRMVRTRDIWIFVDPDEKGPVQISRFAAGDGYVAASPDVWRLGLSDWYFSSPREGGYDDYFLRSDRTNLKIEPGAVGGEAIWKVSFQVPIPGGERASMEYWIAPKMGNLPLHLESRVGKGKDRWARSLEIKLSKVANRGGDGIWFPKETVFRMTRGDKVTEEEIVTVKEAVFGEPAADEVFSLAGLGLREGRVVLDGVDIMVWTGQGLARQHGDLSPVETAPGRRGRNWMLLANAVALAVAAAGFLWYFWRRRAAERKTS